MQESEEEEESDDEEEVLQHRQESEGEASEAAQPPCAPVVKHIVERSGVDIVKRPGATWRQEGVGSRNSGRRLAHAILAKEQAAASSEGITAASEAAAEGGEGCEPAVDESGGAVAEGQHEGGSDSQQKKQEHPVLTPTLTLTPNPITPTPITLTLTPTPNLTLTLTPNLTLTLTLTLTYTCPAFSANPSPLHPTLTRRASPACADVIVRLHGLWLARHRACTRAMCEHDWLGFEQQPRQPQAQVRLSAVPRAGAHAGSEPQAGCSGVPQALHT